MPGVQVIPVPFVTFDDNISERLVRRRLHVYFGMENLPFTRVSVDKDKTFCVGSPGHSSDLRVHCIREDRLDVGCPGSNRIDRGT